MIKFQLYVVLIFFAMPGICGGMQTEPVPNSSLSVSFPPDWNFARMYVGDGKYSSINLYLPKEDHGGYPAFPDFEFEFLSSGSKDKKLDYLSNTELATIKLAGIESKKFSYNPEVRYLHGDMSHSYATQKVSVYLVPVDNGHLICSLTTESKVKDEHEKYIATLETYCISAINSAKSPKEK